MKKVLDWLHALRAESPELAKRQEAIQRRIEKLRKSRGAEPSRNESEKTPVSGAKNNGLDGSV